MDIHAIAKTYWTNQEALHSLAALVRVGLSGVTVPIGTTALLGRLGADLGDVAGMKNLFAHLANARKTKLVEGYWTAGKPMPGTRGFPSYKWHDRA